MNIVFYCPVENGTFLVPFLTMKRTGIRIPPYLRQQVDELIQAGVVSTVNEAVRSGLTRLVHEYRLQRWDDQLFAEYQAGVLGRDGSGVWLSIAFRRDMRLLSKRFPEIRERVVMFFRKLANGNTKSMNIQQTSVNNLYVVSIILRNTYVKLLFKRQSQQIIACRIGYTTELL